MTEQLRQTIEICGWYVNEQYGYLESNSPLGEDLIIQCCEGQSFKDAILSELESYDVDEHVELWADYRGKNGVPSSYSDLVHDAEDIEEMLEDLWFAVKDIEEENEE